LVKGGKPFIDCYSGSSIALIAWVEPEHKQ